MKIGLQTWGSEGDINPFIALAAGLVRAGHQVKLCITEVSQRDYAHHAKAYGFELIQVPNPKLPSVDMMAKMAEAFKAIRDPSEQLKIINTYFLYPAESAMFDVANALCASCDLVVRHIFCYPTQLAAELHDIPVATLYPVHNIVPNAIQAPFGAVHLGKWAIPLWWRLAQYLINRVFLKQINALRENHHQKRIDDVLTQAWRNESLNLIAVSNAVSSKDFPWPRSFKVCGFLRPPQNDSRDVIDQEMAGFLRAQSAPIYFTFGSMLVPDERSWRSVYEIWRAAVLQLGCRAIFQLPSACFKGFNQDPQILIVQRSSHHLIFPHCSAVVHHGGAGTTQTSLLAACPSVVVAHIADQPFWGSELKRLGVSPGWMRKNEMTSRSLSRFLSLILQEKKYKEKAVLLSQLMQEENAIELATHALIDLHQRWNTATFIST